VVTCIECIPYRLDFDETARRLAGSYPEATTVNKDESASPRQGVVDYQQLEGEPTYEELRAEAALHAKLRAETFQKAASAHAKKQYDLASFYARQVLSA